MAQQTRRPHIEPESFLQRDKDILIANEESLFLDKDAFPGFKALAKKVSMFTVV